MEKPNTPVANSSQRIRKLFKEYEKYFRSLNFSDQAKLFGKQMIAASPTGIAFHRNNIFTRIFYSWAMRTFYKKVEMTSIEIISLGENPISNEFAIVNIHWGATFKKTEDKIVKFDISYLVSTIADETKIVMYISHEDERKALERHNVI